MSDEREQSDLAGGDDTDAVEQVVEEVRDDIRHGQVEDDVSSVLEDRLTEAGVELRPETIDDLAEDIENDVSL
jgi:molybdopterin-biosynthesis enzyme MoeA-like protein